MNNEIKLRSASQMKDGYNEINKQRWISNYCVLEPLNNYILAPESNEYNRNIVIDNCYFKELELSTVSKENYVTIKNCIIEKLIFGSGSENFSSINIKQSNIGELRSNSNISNVEIIGDTLTEELQIQHNVPVVFENKTIDIKIERGECKIKDYNANSIQINSSKSEFIELNNVAVGEIYLSGVSNTKLVDVDIKKFRIQTSNGLNILTSFIDELNLLSGIHFVSSVNSKINKIPWY